MDFDDDTYSALLLKHPAPHPHTYIPTMPLTPVPILVSPGVVLATIQSFQNRSTGGPEKLKPLHLKDLIQGMETMDDPPF